MALRIPCKLSSEYLKTLLAVGDFGSRGLLGCSEISDLGGGEESGGATEGTTEGTTEGAMEGRSQRGRLRLWTEIISELELELIFF